MGGGGGSKWGGGRESTSTGDVKIIMESVSNANILGTVLYPVSLLGGGGEGGGGRGQRVHFYRETSRS